MRTALRLAGMAVVLLGSLPFLAYAALFQKSYDSSQGLENMLVLISGSIGLVIVGCAFAFYPSGPRWWTFSLAGMALAGLAVAAIRISA